ncbi:MAG: hypothetical protein ACI9Y1_001332 [Lentisphaeria bacterium]|jgi:hypothetical protein
MAALRYAAIVLQKLSTPVCEKTLSDEHVPTTDYHTVDVNRLDVFHPRSNGAEKLCLHALMHLSLDDKLRTLGFN